MECVKCGDCCRQVLVEVPSVDVPYYAYHGIPIVCFEGHAYIFFDKKCMYISSTNNCLIFEKRPAACRNSRCVRG